MSIFQKFKAHFAKMTGGNEAEQEQSFNDFFAKEVGDAVETKVSAAVELLEGKIKALEQKETPNTEGFVTTETVKALENKLNAANEALNKANSSIEALTTKADQLAETLANKAAEAPKGKENTTIAIPNKAENTGYKGGFV